MKTALDQEAHRLAEEYYARYITTCGDDSYFIFFDHLRNKRYIAQYRKLKIDVMTDPLNPLTPADRLNGLEWFGLSEIKGEAFRKYDMTTRRWGEWIDLGRHENLWTRIEKVRGQWKTQPSCFAHPAGCLGGTGDPWKQTQRVDCNAVPK